MRKFGITAGDDLDNLSHLVGEGATRLRGRFLFSVLFFYNRLIDLAFSFTL